MDDFIFGSGIDCLPTSIVILNWNGLCMLKTCIESIRANTENCEIIVVDNGSNERGTKKYIRENADKYMFLPYNTGFPKGNNHGFDLATNELVCFMNNDVIVGKNWLNEMQKTMFSHNSCGIVAASGNPREVMIDNVKYLFPQYRGQFKSDTKINGVWLVAHCIVVRKSIFSKIRWDEDFGIGLCEDHMLGYMMNRNGYSVWISSKADVKHEHPSSSFSRHKDYPERMKKARQLLCKKINEMPEPKVNYDNERILVACPTSLRHINRISDWLKNVRKLNHPNVDIFVVDTTKDDDKYSQYLSLLGIKHVRCPHNESNEHPLQMLARAREIIRKEFIQGEYTHLLSLDDDIYIPPNGLRRLLDDDKDVVGFVVHIYAWPNEQPCVFKSGNILFEKNSLDFYSWSEIKAKYPNLVKVYACSIGCCLIKKKVLINTEFITHPSFILGEDLWWYSIANNKGFEFYCDTSYRTTHNNTDWCEVLKGHKEQVWKFKLEPIEEVENVQ